MNFDQVLLGGEVVKRVYNNEILGVIIDSNLPWIHHVLNLSKKISDFVPIIHCIRHLCTEKSLKLIYDCLIYSNLIYCNTVLGYCKKNAISPLKQMYKKKITGFNWAQRDTLSQQMFRDSSLLTLDLNNVYMVCVFLYKALDGPNFCNWSVTAPPRARIARASLFWQER